MVTPILQKVLASVIVIFVLGYVGFRLYSQTPDTSAQVPEAEEQIGQNILSLVNQLKTVSIDDSFFTSQILLTLKDYSVLLNPEFQGRPNPFAPIGAETGTQSKASTR